MQQCKHDVYSDTNLYNYIWAKSSDNKNDAKKKKKQVFALIQLVSMAAYVMIVGNC